MTVFELKAILADVPGDYTVILATDDEGNDFRELQGYSNGHYDDQAYTDEAEIDATADEDEEPSEINSIALWP